MKSPDKMPIAKKRELPQPDGEGTTRKRQKKVAVLHQSIISPPVDITDLACNLATALTAAQLALSRLQCAMDELPLKMLHRE